ncbi:propionate--coA ligase [Escherichia coli]|uniref:Propionate--coA ligase n=1 Tax=Escherichia coli TaxID=562 RepID=A0A485JJC2_ECOLX|nr:propionate--coA ligase [Escherichia coli]
MSFSEFYQRSINEPEQFWAEQARRIDWQTPFTQTLDHSNPPFARWFCGRPNQLVSQRYRPAGWRNSQRRWR